MEIIVATRNQGKIEEIKEYLKDDAFVVYSVNDFPGAPHLVEDGKTFKENALKKARALARRMGKISIADDSGLEVDALGGRPGVFSARYAGENATDDENNEKLLEEMKGVPFQERGASFRCVLALVEPSGQETIIEETCQGIIGNEKQGSGGFGYDPLFYVSELGKTFAELTREEKNRISHRGRALRKLKEILKEKALARVVLPCDSNHDMT